jgi:hypothetical protein
MQFYEQCPVLTAEREQRASRLLVCRRVADTLQHGLSLLGIETVERIACTRATIAFCASRRRISVKRSRYRRT